MRKFLTPIAAALLAAAITTSIAMAGHSHRGGDQRFRQERAPYAIGLWGDLPYSTTQATTGVPNLIADMNSQNLAFTAHDGDLKSGSSECTNAVYTQALSYFNSLRAPAAFTPGDNDWVDCDRTPGYNDRVQLGKERQRELALHVADRQAPHDQREHDEEREVSDVDPTAEAEHGVADELDAAEQ